MRPGGRLKEGVILRLSIICFPATGETKSALDTLASDRRLSRSKIAVRGGGIDGAAAFLAEYESPQLLLIEAVEKGEALFSALARLSQVCDPKSKVVLLGSENDIFLYKHLMGMGLSEYYCGPLTPDALIDVIETLYSEAGAANLGRVISFFGARGGAGSSTLAANTAYALGQQFGEKVVLLDLDLAFGSAALGCNLQMRQSLSDALAEPERLDSVMIERFMLKYDDNLSLVAAPSTLGENTRIELEPFAVLLKLVREMASFVVLDLPHRWESWINEVLVDSNEVVITAYPDLLNLRDVKNIFEKLGPNRGVDAPIRLVFNRVGEFKKRELTPKEFQEAVGVAPTLSLPFAPAPFGSAMNAGDMLAKLDNKNKVVKEIDRLAAIVSGRDRSPAKKKGSSLLGGFKRA